MVKYIYIAHPSRHLPITSILLAKVDTSRSFGQSSHSRLRPTTLRVLLRQEVFPLLLIIPPQNISKLYVEFGIAEKISALFDKSGGINVILSKKIDQLQKLVVKIAIVQNTFYSIKEISFIVNNRWPRQRMMGSSTRGGWACNNMFRIVRQRCEVLSGVFRFL